MNSADAETKTLARSDPRQERSRVRKQALLDAVEGIVTRVGLDGLEMREVARTAGLPIASVYHYFPAKAAIVRELAVRQLGEVRSILVAQATNFPAGRGVPELALWIDGLIEAIYRQFKAKPSISAILHAVHADPELRRLDQEDSAQNAITLVPLMKRLLPSSQAGMAHCFTRVAIEMITSSILLAVDNPASDQQADTVHAVKALLVSMLAGLPALDAAEDLLRPTVD